MTQLRFVNAGEPLEAFERSRTRNDERAWQGSVRARAVRDDDQRQQVDAAMREAATSGESTGLLRVSADGEAGEPAVGTWRAPVIKRLASTPGGGAQAVALRDAEEKHQAGQRTAARQESRESREMKYRGLEQFNKAMDNGDIDTARVVARQFQLGIPDEAFSNQRVSARLRGIATTLHRSGVRGETAAEVFRAAIENPDTPIEQAVQTGMAAGARRADRNDLIETPQGWFNLRTKTYETDGSGQTLRVPDRRLSHAPRAGAGGTGPRVQRTLELADGTVKLVMSDGSTRILTGQDGRPDRGAGAARRAASLVGKMISPIQTAEERNAAVREGVSISGRIADEVSRGPAAAPRVRYDAQGNRVE